MLGPTAFAVFSKTAVLRRQRLRARARHTRTLSTVDRRDRYTHTSPFCFDAFGVEATTEGRPHI